MTVFCPECRRTNSVEVFDEDDIGIWFRCTECELVEWVE